MRGGEAEASCERLEGLYVGMEGLGRAGKF